MGFLDVPAPNPRTKEYYIENAEWVLSMMQDAIKMKYPQETTDMLWKLSEHWYRKAEYLNKNK